MSEERQRIDFDKKISNALNKIYFASNYCDLKTHTFITVASMEYCRKMVENCKTMEEAFEAFIETLVKPEYKEKMQEFCRIDTIASRLKGKTHIDCEYMSKVTKGWCQASFLPVEWDEKGEISHVLFVVSDIDNVKVKEIEEGIENKKNLEAIFNEAPGGIVLYEWDGKELKILNMSKYYQDLYGYSMINDKGIPDYKRIHPDDLEDYKKAIYKALTETHTLEYVFRVWNRRKSKYVWTKVEAIAKYVRDDKALVYAMYSDVTEQKIAEQRLKKSNASIMAALDAAEQFSYEYDPVEHTSTCFTEENNGYNLDHVIKNYPECFRENGFMHPDDVELFIDTVHKIDNGEESAHCLIRANKDGRYRWHSCTFDAFYDSEKDRRVALLTVVDITPKVIATKSYENRLQMLIRANEDALCMCDVNLTQNSFSNIQAEGIIKECGEKAGNIDEFLQLSSSFIYDEQEKENYLKLFNRKNLISMYEKGENHIRFEHFYKVSENHTEWVETVFDLVGEPSTGDIVGICYAKSLNKTKIPRILLKAALEKDYPMAALVYAETGEYYMFETEKNEFCVQKQGYWEKVYSRLSEAVDESDSKELAEIRENLTKEKVINYLKKYKEYSYAFYGLYHGETCRLEAKFRYVDKSHDLLIATLRNITDTALYRKYKHDSEHDELTGLLKRNTLFRRCRQLLNEYPDEQFVMLHGDIKHFHLYNTFFGDEGGNELICNIADYMRRFDKDYDHWVYGRIEADVFCAFFPLCNSVLKSHIECMMDEIPNSRNDFLIEPAIGIYMVEDKSMSIEAMFTRASIAAKSGKKNLFGVISIFDEDMNRELNDKQQILSEMQTAIETEQFKVYLQPKYSLESKNMTGAEALVRWVHPEKGIISPGRFIPIFEKNGYITTLDRYMWEHVCKILKRWQEEGRNMYPVSVNVSRNSMYIQSTVSYLKELVTRYNLDPKYLQLELTESAYMDDPTDLKRMLRELKEFGFTILMDDFGSGYSSLNTLRELPVDVLKLDMKFLTESQADNRGMVVLSSVVHMSKLLDLPVIAEGVETVEQAEYLRNIGCEYAQGYLFAKPMPVNEYEKILEQEKESKNPEKVMENISINDIENEKYLKYISEIVNMFDRVIVVDFEKETFTNVNKKRETGQLTYYTDNFEKFYKNITGRFYNSINRHSCNCFFSEKELKNLFENKDDFYFECRDKYIKGGYFGVNIHCMNRKDGIPVKIIYAVKDITDAKQIENEYRKKLKKANERLKDLANHDGLTGLYNRRGLVEAVDIELDEDSLVALILLDIDDFKKVNDTAGHQNGDKLLIKISELLKKSFRTNDIIARLGGDEFMVILKNCDREHGDFIPKKIDEINKMLHEASDDGSVPAGSISAGVTFSQKGETQELYDRADAALYIAKDSGKNCCCVYEEEMNDK